MKYLVVNDEHELYQVMYADMFKEESYDVKEIEKFNSLPSILKKIKEIHFSDRINRHIWLPGKFLWNRFYTLSNYKFDKEETYWIIFLNGTLRNYYSMEYLQKLKRLNSNIKLALVMYDSYSNNSTKRVVNMISVFDKVFSFDPGDCKRHGFEYIYSTFSKPDFVENDEKYKNNIFFVGAAATRLDLLHRCFNNISSKIENCEFRIVGVEKKQQEFPQYIKYNQSLSYKEALKYAYNSECLIEVVREGQTGVTLRTCEAILFNKKLLTNNKQLLKMPFYNKCFMKVFDKPEDIDINFLLEKIEVDYKYDGFFSPINILKSLERTKNNA